MTMKLTAKRFRIRRAEPVEPLAPRAALVQEGMLFSPAPGDDGFGDQSFVKPLPANPASASAPPASAPALDPTAPGTEMDAIRREGLTGRQLRLARRLAQKHNLPATSDFDAVRLLRQAGLDPFQRSSLMDLLPDSGGGGDEPPPRQGRALAAMPGDGVQLPQTIKPVQLPSTEVQADQSHAQDIMRIQRDLARRRRRKVVLLAARLFFFVGLPTLLTAFYYFFVASPLYATKTEFVIQQSGAPASGGAGGLGGLLQGTGFATSQDSIAVQGYLQSRDAMIRLDKDHGFRAHFEAADIDPIQRLDPGATLEKAYKTYMRNIHISYDPREGIIKMEVIAASPDKAVEFARALVGYAEEQVDQLTQRMREDQMQGARDSYEDAEREMIAAQRNVVTLQEKYKVLSSEIEVQLISTQIGNLETQLSADRLSLQQMESNARPNQARMEPLKRRIGALESEIALLRSKLTEQSGGVESLAVVQGELLVAQSDVETRRLLLAQALQAMETSRIEANRQTRYLSLPVSPVAPDEAAYPRAFEYSVVALLIFGGIYLMISMTAAILREQVTG